MRAIIFFVFLLFTSPDMPHDLWQSIAHGLDLASFSASQPGSSGDSRITVLRIDLWSLEFIGLSLNDETSSGWTARQWSKAHGLTAVIEESRYPGFFYRSDKNFIDDENWKCLVNSVYDKKTRTWTLFKRAHTDLVDKSRSFK